MNCLSARLYYTLLIIAAVADFSCSRDEGSTAVFESVPVANKISPLIAEASGIADSRSNPGFIWVQEDSGNPAGLYLVSHTGQVTRWIPAAGVTNRDWEDIAICNNDIYLAETGDNNLSYSEYSIYHFAEPTALADSIRNVERIRFAYPDGSHDAEALLVDPSSRDIFIITKRDASSKVYKLSSYNASSVNIATLVATLPYTGVVSAALSENEKELIIKTYTKLYYYQKGTTSLQAAFQMPYKELGYQQEPQGEAICFRQDNKGFFTLSEKAFAAEVFLNYYKRR